jgi:hypothetical protein
VARIGGNLLIGKLLDVLGGQKGYRLFGTAFADILAFPDGFRVCKTGFAA